MSCRKINLITLVLVLIAVVQMAAAGTIAASSSASHHIFSQQLFKHISSNHLHENVIFSPASIQTALALVFQGATGKTEEALRSGLYLGLEPKETIAANYAEFIRGSFGAPAKNGPILTMANNIYMNEALDINSKFADTAKTYFNSMVEKMNFGRADEAVKQINNWVEEQTNHKIQNLLQPGSVDGETSSVIVNAIYFKALWQTQFSDASTSKRTFHMEDRDVSVDMMYGDESFKYADLPDLDAAAISMPYLNSDLSMVIILPNQNKGLRALETKLADIDLNQIVSKMTDEDVEVSLPRFKIDMELNMKETLSTMGLKTIFSEEADFSGIVENPTERLRISDVKHKAFLEVNEAGSEAAAATFLKIVPMSWNFRQKTFTADHPFVFAIMDTKAVYFAGHVTSF